MLLGYDGHNHSQTHLLGASKSFLQPKFGITSVCFESEIQKMLLKQGPPTLMSNHGLLGVVD